MRRLAVALLVFTLVSVSPYAYAGTGNNNSQSLTGTWRITVTLPPGASVCPPGPDSCLFLALATTSDDGTAVQTAALPAISTGHGVWQRVGSRTFTVRTTYFRYDASGVLIGTAETFTTLSLTKDGLSASGEYAVTLLDLTGTEVGAFAGTVVATRLVP